MEWTCREQNELFRYNGGRPWPRRWGLAGWLVIGCFFTAAVAGCVYGPLKPMPPELHHKKRRITYEQHASTFALSNGLTVLVVPDNNTNLVKVDVRYKVGFTEDPPGKEGLAHLVEHLTFSARPLAHNGSSLKDMLGVYALDNNAYTNLDETHYTATALDARLGSLIAVEGYRMRATCDQLDDAILARDREVVRNELRERAGAWQSMYRDLFRAVYGEQHPYARMFEESDHTVASITRDDVCEFLQRYYQPANATLVVSGKVSEDELKKIVLKMFNIRGAAVPKRAPLPAVGNEWGMSRHLAPIADATALITFAAPRSGGRLAVLHRMATRLLNMRLFVVQQKHKYITEVELFTTGGDRAPLTVVEVTVNDESKLQEAVKLVLEATNDLGSDISQRFFVSVRESLRAQLLARVESFGIRAQVMLDYLEADARTGFFGDDLVTLGKITRDEVKTHAASFLSKDKNHVALFYPDPGKPITEPRAALRYQPHEHEGTSWQLTIDPGEAERDLDVKPSNLAAQVREFSLPNGMNVYLAPSSSFPVVDIRVIFSVGRLHEPPDKPGLAWLAAAFLRPSFEYQYSSYDRNDIMLTEQMGADEDRKVTEYSTVFHSKGLSMYVDGLLWRLYYLLDGGYYDADMLALFRKLLTERDNDDEDGEERLVRSFMAELFGPEYALARHDTDALMRISKDDLETFRRAYYRTNNAAIVVTGQFDADMVEAEIQRLFGSWPVGEAPPPPPRPRLRLPLRDRAAHLAIHNPDAIQTTLSMGFAVPAGNLRRSAARLVLEEILTLKLGALRKLLGVTYGTSVSYIPRPGLFWITAEVDRERAGEAFVAMQALMEEIRAGAFVPELVLARRRVVQSMLADTLSSEKVADKLEAAELLGQDREFHDKLLRLVGGLRPKDIQALIDTDLARERAVILVEGREDSVNQAYTAAGISDFRVLE